MEKTLEKLMGMCTKLSQGFSEMEKNVLREKLDLTQVKKITGRVCHFTYKVET